MECCEDEENKQKDKTFWKGLIYGLVPHAGCIAFILFSLFGVTGAVFLFRPLLLNPYFFYILIAVSIVFATVSAIFYLKNKKILCYCKNEKGREISFSLEGIKKEWKYFTTLYGTTILVNLLLFMVIFPLTANLTSASFSPQSYTGKISTLTLQVSIPCPGHAPLISDELRKLSGILNVKFNFPNYFDVSYDPGKVSKQEILSLDVFKTFNANVVSENLVANTTNSNPVQSNPGGCGCGCGGGCTTR